MRRALVAVLLLPLAFAAAVTARAAYLSERTFHVPRVHPPRPAGLDVRDVHLRTSDGLDLFAWWVPSGNGAAILLLHGSGKSRGQLVPEARALAAAGYGVLLLDMRGHGDSQGEISWGDRERLDVAAALGFLRSQPGVSRLGALGFSLGAIALAPAALDAPDLGAVVLVSPFPTLRSTLDVDFGRWGALSIDGALLAYRWHGIDLTESPADAMRRTRIPLLVITGGAESLPWKPGELDASLPPGSEHWVIPGASHGDAMQVDPGGYTGKLLAYFGRRLVPAGAPASP